MGLPCSLKGRSYQSRMGAGYYAHLISPELITPPEEYEALAIELATNPEKLKVLKISLP